MRRGCRRALVMALLLAVNWPASAQTPPPPQRAAQAPARDAGPVPEGTAVIRGRVIRADTKQPLRRAQVRVSGGELGRTVTAGTNVRGQYEIRDLPAGRYTVTVTRTGYLTLQNGQRYPDEPGTPLELRTGGEVEIDFAMPRASIISGRVVDEMGDLVAGVRIWPLQPRFFEGERRFVPVGGRAAETDESGEYRITGVAPGEYVIMAVLRETWTARTPEPVMLGYAPSYHPAATSPAEAQRVQVGVGEEVGAIDISLVPGRIARVSGTATLADGAPAVGGTVSLSQRIAGPGASYTAGIMSGHVAADGIWELRDVPPGAFELTLTASDAGRGGPSVTVPLVVHGADVTGIALTPVAPGRISGTVVTDDGTPLAKTASPPRLTAENLAPGMRRGLQSGTATDGVVNPDGTFALGGVPPGRMWLRLVPLPSGWGIRRVLVQGRDHTDAPIEVHGGQDLGNVQIVVSRNFPTVTGTTVDENGEPVHGTVLLFPVDPALWHGAAGTLHHTRPDQHGSFTLGTVRPGEYFAVALDYVQTWQATDPGFLDGLRRRAIKVRVVEGDNEPLVLRVHR